MPDTPTSEVMEELLRLVGAGLVHSAEGNTHAAKAQLSKIAALDDQHGSAGHLLYAACDTWADAAIRIAGFTGQITTTVVPMDHARPETVEEGENLAGYLAAVNNGDRVGAVLLWSQLTPEASVALTWAVLTFAGAAARQQARSGR